MANATAKRAEAYAVLSDAKKRADYDAGASPEDLFGGVDLESIFGEFGFGETIFDRFFGGRRRGPQRGADIEIEAMVPLERIARGGEETVRYRRVAACAGCKGAARSPEPGRAPARAAAAQGRRPRRGASRACTSAA